MARSWGLHSGFSGWRGYWLWHRYVRFRCNRPPHTDMYHAVAKFEEMRGLYNEYGALIVFSAGFSPIPYKVFTIARG